MADGGPVLTQPSASALRVAAPEDQPQPPAKRLRQDTEIAQRTNDDPTVQNQPTLPSPPITSREPELSRSKAPNASEFTVNPASVVSFSVV